MIALVDDNMANLKLLEMHLKDSYNTLLFTGGKAFLQYLNSDQAKPDMVLLDRMMPGISGDDVCNTMKNNEATSNIPIIMCSALTSESDIEMGITAGADGYLVKPVSRTDLFDELSKFFKQ